MSLDSAARASTGRAKAMTIALLRRLAVVAICILALELMRQVYGCSQMRILSAVSCPLTDTELLKGLTAKQLNLMAMRLLVEASIGFALTALVAGGLALTGLFDQALDHSLNGAAIISQVVPFWIYTIVLNTQFDVSPGAIVVASSAIFSFFPVYSSYRDALKSVPVDVDDILRISVIPRAKRVFLIESVRALPVFFSGLRLATPYVVGGALLAEALVFDRSGDRGVLMVGKQLEKATREFGASGAARTVVLLLIALACTAVLYSVVSLVDRTLCRWHYREVVPSE